MPDRFYIVDVFAEQAYAGNPLAVVTCDAFPAADTMQKIAAETNFSETTFVITRPEMDGGYRMRIFTPAREIEFTGHPLLGSAWVVREFLSASRQSSVQLNTPVGAVQVDFEQADSGNEVTWFTAPQLLPGKVAPIEPVAAALGLQPEDIDLRSPVQVVSAGTSAMILDAFAGLAQQGFPPLLYLVSRQTRKPENDLCVRFFFEAHGVREDPATGNGAAFLGRYLLEHATDSSESISLSIEQGHDLRRPSLILLQATMVKGVARVRVGGQVLLTVQGQLHD
jgi:trans-2,3-dihydro-3-hydroxyanthranilate isomerase